ncbi:MAG: FAD-dependent monooxygenase [Myxococcota bacterium]|nr:FAD-dependent monooxygenase [Myxococcota bacterium]
MLPREVPVLIVGAGPSGAMTALLLERLGVESLVVERRAAAQPAPAAHVVNARTFEICRAAGVDMDAISRAAIAPEDAGWVEWVTKLGGKSLGRLPFERQGDDQLEFTPTPLRNLSQNRFEPILLETLDAAPHWQCQWESAEQDAEGVTSRIRDLASGELHEVRSRYVVAADGAGSRVRRWLGIEPQGPDRLQTFVMIHFKAALRSRLGSPPSVLHFVANPERAGVFVVHDLDEEAVFMVAYDDQKESLDDYDAERCAGLVSAALQDPDLDFRVETISTWAMTAQVAKRYREGRVFLAGDAAHRFPPTGGLGLNSGVQDAHNLAWKLAFVLQGLAGEELLESYERERRPVAQNNANQSLKNALRLIEVPQALGIGEPGADARGRMEAVLASEEGRERVAEAIAHQAEHFDMPGLQLGFSYAPDVPPPDPRRFEPSGAPGSRLPHAWLEEEGAQQSLLDRVPLAKFLLLAGPEGGAWTAAAEALGSACLVAHELSKDELPDLPRWLELAGIEASGALLVRPDQHVAWRAPTDADTGALPEALGRALRGASFADGP